jgi:hypothetical protein
MIKQLRFQMTSHMKGTKQGEEVEHVEGQGRAVGGRWQEKTAQRSRAQAQSLRLGKSWDTAF